MTDTEDEERKPARAQSETAYPEATDSEENDVSIPWRSPTVQVVFSSSALAPFSVALVAPGLPVFRDAFGTTDAGASLLLSAILVPGIFLSPLLGLLTDRVGRRRVLVASLAVWSVAGGLVVLGPPFRAVLALRFVQGTALAGIGVTTVTLVADTFDEVRRNAVLGANTAVLSAAAAVYPLLGGALVAVSWTAPFATYLLGLPVALFALRALEEPAVERETRSLVYLRRVVGALSVREAATLYGSAFLVDFLLFGAVFTAVPFLLDARYGLSALLVGLVLTAGEAASTVAAAANGRLARRLSDHDIIVVGFLATGVGLAGAWLAPSPAFVALAALGFGAGWGVTLPSIDAGVSDVVPARFRAGALSLRGSASFGGRAAGPILTASLASRTGYRPLLALGGACALAFAAALFAARR